MIVMSKGEVKNLTTGAMMWLSAAVGLAAGNGLWPIAALAAVIGLVIITLHSWLPGGKG
jgi:putative Mg2+ transporter-C (MgtC) family protein